MFNFSILHTSARPEKWREIYDEWLAKADNPDLVQYILVGDQRWGFDKYNPGLGLRDQDTYLLLDPQRKCYVEGVNLAARYSRGRTLIVNADDQHPCQDWDVILNQAIFLNKTIHENSMNGEYVLRVPTGTTDEITRNITVMPVLSRARYLRLGYVFYPGYESMYADNDLTEHAQLDGVLYEVNSPVFPHRHPFFTDAKMDEQYAQQNRKEAYTMGAALLRLRRATGFGTGQTTVQAAPPPTPTRKTIAVCLPGESFSSIWVSCWTELFLNLFSRFNTVPVFCFCSNVHVTRGTLAKQILSDCGGLQPDYVLWIDDDNPVVWRHVEMLLQDLDSLPDADGVSGWCWIHDQVNARYVASCGIFNPDWTCTNYTSEVFDSLGAFDCVQFQFTGFPLFLMRGVGPLTIHPHPFAPIECPTHPHGAMSEDTSYCRRAMDAGLKFYVDRRVKVDHLKLGPLGPETLAAAVTKAISAVPTPEPITEVSPAAA